MWSNFYAAGGWGMHPTSLFGFLLLAALGVPVGTVKSRMHEMVRRLREEAS